MKSMLKPIIPTLIIATTLWLVAPKYQILLTENMRDPIEGPAIWKLDRQTGKLFYCRENLEYSFQRENEEITSKEITYLGPVCYPETPVNNSNRSTGFSSASDEDKHELKHETDYEKLSNRQLLMRVKEEGVSLGSHLDKVDLATISDEELDRAIKEIQKK